MKKCTLSFTDSEIVYLGGLLDALTDYMAGDNRPDHGMARIKWYREQMPTQMKNAIYGLSGKIKWHRLHCRRKDKQVMP